MFKTFNKDGKFIEEYSNFKNAVNSRPYKILDNEGYVFYTDGSGSGFTALRQDNTDMHLGRTGWPLYNAKKRSLSCIKRSSWHIYWELKDLKKVKEFHKTVRQKIKNGTFEVLKEK